MKETFYRLKARWRLILHHGVELNRRVEIENTLFAMSKDKLPLPTKEICRQLALKLGGRGDNK